ncbi:DedA family protein [Streptomyces sp. WMMB303]|uniref:DedA family protein n=1 Tax=Streptomyces sp. WMMB303 TaxID=3034154 RepID=UPI0023ED5D18|nr:DedA family protein [Streptomyces sp. WMMB303]MDF4254157.1 DedA family protein [Streptomyces sp. WMMB303]
MNEAIVHAVEGFVSTPWVYLALFGIAMLDGFFPVVPSETLVITLGVFAATQADPALGLVIVVAALGAFAGDHISYALGRRSGARIRERLRKGSRAHRVYERVGRMLAERGGLVLVAARYIPGGRTAATLTTGATGFPRRSFTRYDAVAAVSWAVYSACLGYAGGTAFEETPLYGVALGLALAFTITLVHEGVRGVRLRLRARASAPGEPGSDRVRAAEPGGQRC